MEEEEVEGEEGEGEGGGEVHSGRLAERLVGYWFCCLG